MRPVLDNPEHYVNDLWHAGVKSISIEYVRSAPHREPGKVCSLVKEHVTDAAQPLYLAGKFRNPSDLKAMFTRHWRPHLNSYSLLRCR